MTPRPILAIISIPLTSKNHVQYDGIPEIARKFQNLVKKGNNLSTKKGPERIRLIWGGVGGAGREGGGVNSKAPSWAAKPVFEAQEHAFEFTRGGREQGGRVEA